MAKLSSSSSSSSNKSPHHFGHFPLWFLSAVRAAKMEGKASAILKQVRHQLASFAKAKLAAVKSKTSAVKTQLTIFRLLHDRKVLMSAISHKIRTLIMSSQVLPEKQEAGAAAASSGHGSKMIARHDNARSPPTEASCEICSVESAGSATCREIISTAEDYANHLISHSLNFNDEAVSGDGTGSADIDVVKDQSQLIREQQLGDQFVQLEEEIDQVAELFIKRIRRQMMLERLESLRRHQLQEGGA